jgi:hypothetical protein
MAHAVSRLRTARLARSSKPFRARGGRGVKSGVSMYVDAASSLGTDIGGGKNGGWTSYFSPTLGRAATKSEIQTFFASNPSQSQIFQKAADLARIFHGNR